MTALAHAPDRRAWLGAAGMALLGAAMPGGARAAPAETGQAVAWPEVRLLDGRRLDAPWRQGRATVLSFFATDCGYCHRHNARLQGLLQAGAGLPLQLLGVAQGADAAAVRRYLAQHGLGIDVTLDEQALHAALVARRSVPMTCVIDRSGVLRERIPGEMAEADVQALARWARA